MLNNKEQIDLFDKILRLSKSGLMQKDIAILIERHGTKKQIMVAKNCIKTIGRGIGFSHGLKEHVSPNAYLSLTSGEEIGNFEQGLVDAIKSLKVDQASSIAIIKALLKPILGLLIVIFITALLAAYAFPFLEEQASRQTWGIVARSAETFGSFWLNNGLMLFLVLQVLVVLMTVSLSRWTGKYRIVLDNIPIYRQYRFIQCSNFLTSIAHQTAVGKSLKEALIHYGKHCNQYMKYHIDVMLRIHREGKTNVGEIFGSGLLDEQEHDTLKILSETGRASVILKKSADIHSDQLLAEINYLKVWGARILNSTLAIIGVWMAVAIGSLAFQIATTLNFN